MKVDWYWGVCLFLKVTVGWAGQLTGNMYSYNISKRKSCLGILICREGRVLTYLTVMKKWYYCFYCSTILNLLWEGQPQKIYQFQSHSFTRPHQALLQRNLSPSENILNLIKLKAMPARLFFLAITHKQFTSLEEKMQGNPLSQNSFLNLSTSKPSIHPRIPILPTNNKLWR